MTDYNRYQRFERRQDNVQQVISANDVNSLQGTLESVQRQVIGAKDDGFLAKCLFALDQNPLVNAMWVDLMEDALKVDATASNALAFLPAERGWAFPDGSLSVDGLVTSRAYVPDTRSTIKSLLLMVSQYVPDGSSISYEVTTDGRHWQSITPSTDNVLALTSFLGSSIQVRARFRRDSTGIHPILYGWAILYRDDKVGAIQVSSGDWIIPPPPESSQTMMTLSHDQLLNIKPDDHHPQEHHHDGTDGSGLVSHKSLIDVGADDHHPKDHHHAYGGVSPVELEHDVAGTLPIGNITPIVQTGFPGTTRLFKNDQEQVFRVDAPDGTTILEYDDQGRLTKATTSIHLGSAAGDSVVTLLEYATDPPTVTTEVKDTQGEDLRYISVATPQGVQSDAS